MKQNIAILTTTRQNGYYLFYELEGYLNHKINFKLDLLTFKDFNEQYSFGNKDIVDYMEEDVSSDALCIISTLETGQICMLGFDYMIDDLVHCTIGNPMLKPILKPLAKRINPKEYNDWKVSFEEESELND